MRTFLYFLLAGAALHAQLATWDVPKVHYVPVVKGRSHKHRIGTIKYANNSQKAKRNRPYYGHRNHKYVIPHKIRK